MKSATTENGPLAAQDLPGSRTYAEFRDRKTQRQGALIAELAGKHRCDDTRVRAAEAEADRPAARNHCAKPDARNLTALWVLFAGMFTANRRYWQQARPPCHPTRRGAESFSAFRLK